MRARSPKRARQERRYTFLRAQYLDTNPWCAHPACTQYATEVHHKRGRVGELLTAVEHWLPLCHTHHVWVTEHPALAKVMGLSENRIGAA